MSDTTRQAAALGVMGLAIVAVLMLGSGAAESAHIADPRADHEAIESGQDHIGAGELAGELMAGGDVVVVDLRPAAEFAAWHLPGAVNMTIPEVASTRGDALFAANPRLVVLCSNGAAHPAQAWLELRRRGRTNVKVLDGGLDEFKAAVLTPASLRGVLDEAAGKAEAAPFALRRAFFLGDPRANPLQTWATDPARLERPTVVSAHWLQQHLADVAVVDMREKAGDYAALHVAGARHLPVAALREKAGGTELFLLPPERLAASFGALGLTRATTVVVYADDKMQDATLAVLAFVRCGHRAVAILEGGVLRWATEKRPLTSVVPSFAPAAYVPEAGADDFTITADEVAARLADGRTQILDVRPPEFFRGDKSTEARPGHIPGSVNRPFAKDLERTPDGQWFRPRAPPAAEYAALGISRDRPVIVSCRTGHQASESYFVLRWLLGHEDVRWFNGSWTEWAARSDLPAELGGAER